MTVVNQALALRTKLLVAEYGRKRVIAALAEAEGVEFETIAREVDGIKEKRSSRHRRPKVLPELLKEAKIDSQTLPLVERIAWAYDQKRYLPELWRVRRFLESHGVDASRVRTRTAALPLVIGALGGLRECELTDIETGLSGSVRGDLGIIADQILGPSKEEFRSTRETAREGDEGDHRARTETVVE